MQCLVKVFFHLWLYTFTHVTAMVCYVVYVTDYKAGSSSKMEGR